MLSFFYAAILLKVHTNLVRGSLGVEVSWISLKLALEAAAANSWTPPFNIVLMICIFYILIDSTKSPNLEYIYIIITELFPSQGH